MLFYDYRVRNVFLKNEYHADLGLAGETSFLSMKKVRNVFQIMTRGTTIYYDRLKGGWGKCDVSPSAQYNTQNSSVYGWQCNIKLNNIQKNNTRLEMINIIDKT